MIYSAIAQLVEQLTVNQLVAGSSPACGAILSRVETNPKEPAADKLINL